MKPFSRNDKIGWNKIFRTEILFVQDGCCWSEPRTKTQSFLVCPHSPSLVSQYKRSDAPVSCMPFPTTNLVTTLVILPKHGLAALPKEKTISPFPNKLY